MNPPEPGGVPSIREAVLKLVALERGIRAVFEPQGSASSAGESHALPHPHGYRIMLALAIEPTRARTSREIATILHLDVDQLRHQLSRFMRSGGTTFITRLPTERYQLTSVGLDLVERDVVRQVDFLLQPRFIGVNAPEPDRRISSHRELGRGPRNPVNGDRRRRRQ
jgi:hypothetical protein